MSLVIKKRAGGGIHIDEGTYEAIIEGITLNKGDDGSEFFTWDFKVSDATIDDDPVEGVVHVRGFANALLTPKSKLTKWATGAGLDVENEDEEEIDLQDAIGASVRIDVEDHETKDGVTISRVFRILPSKKAKKKKRDDDDERSAKKKGKKKPRHVDDEEEEEVEDEDEEEEEKPKKGKKDKDEKKGKKKPRPVDDEDEDEEEEKPKKGKKDKSKKEKSKKKDEDESEDDDDDLYDFDDDEDADDDDD